MNAQKTLEFDKLSSIFSATKAQDNVFMDRKTAPSSVYQNSSNHDELYMQQSLAFSETLMEMKNLRKQLYSAAEFFEKSYVPDDQKQMVMETVKDYAIKSLISTVDHLGSVAYRVESFLDEKIGEVSAMDFRFSCFKQRVQTCQKFVGQAGISRQSMLMNTPKLHRRYVAAAVDDRMDSLSTAKPKSFSRNWHKIKDGMFIITNPAVSRESHSALQSPRFCPEKGTFTFIRTSSNPKSEKRAPSPHRFPFLRSGSVQMRSSSPTAKAERRHPSEPRRSIAGSMYGGREKGMDIEEYSSKSKQLFKAMLSMRKSRKEGTFYKYLDQL